MTFDLVVHTGKRSLQPVDKSVGKPWKESAEWRCNWLGGVLLIFAQGTTPYGFTYWPVQVKQKYGTAPESRRL